MEPKGRSARTAIRRATADIAAKSSIPPTKHRLAAMSTYKSLKPAVGAKQLFSVAAKRSVNLNPASAVAAEAILPASTSKAADAPKNQARARTFNQIEVKGKRGKGR